MFAYSSGDSTKAVLIEPVRGGPLFDGRHDIIHDLFLRVIWKTSNSIKNTFQVLFLEPDFPPLIHKAFQEKTSHDAKWLRARTCRHTNEKSARGIGVAVRCLEDISSQLNVLCLRKLRYLLGTP